MKQKIANFLSSTGYSGYFPIAPGTVGASIALIALWLISMPFYANLIFIALFFGLGVWAATLSEKEWGHDAGRINWDEVVGMMVALISIPHQWMFFLSAFLLFRVFDIIKPYPANVSQNVPKGWGVMLDDIIAGIYTNIILQIIILIFI